MDYSEYERLKCYDMGRAQNEWERQQREERDRRDRAEREEQEARARREEEEEQKRQAEERRRQEEERRSREWEQQKQEEWERQRAYQREQDAKEQARRKRDEEDHISRQQHYGAYASSSAVSQSSKPEYAHRRTLPENPKPKYLPTMPNLGFLLVVLGAFGLFHQFLAAMQGEVRFFDSDSVLLSAGSVLLGLSLILYWVAVDIYECSPFRKLFAAILYLVTTLFISVKFITRRVWRLLSWLVIRLAAGIRLIAARTLIPEITATIMVLMALWLVSGIIVTVSAPHRNKAKKVWRWTIEDQLEIEMDREKPRLAAK